jgi:dipeptidyl aminopeptidase/acylaminoacyl peptidase
VYRAYLELPLLVRGGEIEPQWLTDGRFWYRDVVSGALRVVDARTGLEQPLVDLDRVRTALPGTDVPWSAITPAADARSVHLDSAGRAHVLDLATYQETTVPADAAGDKPRVVMQRFPYPSGPLLEVPSPDGRWFATLKDNDIWLREANSDRLRRLTHGATADRAWGVIDFLSAWAQFSPDSRHLVALRHDFTGTHRTPMVDWLSIPETITSHSYPLPGRPLPSMRLAFIDVDSGAVSEIATGDDEYYLRAVGFVREGRELLISRLSRDCKRLDLLAVEVPGGRTRTVVSETADTFIDWSPSFLARGPEMTLLPDGESFLWMSERDGWRHLYLYDLDGKLVRQVTKGAYPVAAVAGVDWPRRRVYVSAHTDPKRFFDTHILGVDLATGNTRQLTEKPGHHRAIVAPDGDTFLDVYSTVTAPPITELRRSDGSLVRELARADISRLTAIGWTPPEELMLPGADGETLLHGVLFRPYDFDPAKRYPVVELIYGGSQAAWRVNSFLPREVIGGEMLSLLKKAYALAQLGFVVAVIDSRGTPGRSKAFHDTIYRKLGSLVVEDHAAVLRGAARTRPYMDMERVGIYGLSFGGYYTVRSMLLAPEIYKVGVAGGTAEFGRGIRASGGEVYLDLLERNPEGYAAAPNAPLAPRLAGKLLLIVGTHDTNTPFSHTMRLADAFIRADKRFDLLVLPGQNHAFMHNDGKPPDLYWWRATIDYLIEHLAP